MSFKIDRLRNRNPFQTSRSFTCLQYKSFENTVGKGEIAKNTFEQLYAIFIKVKIAFCKLYLKFAILEGVKIDYV